MLTSTSLCPIPFLGHCDNSRLQMSAKQLSQSVTNPRCQVPKIIGENYRLLSDSTKLFKLTAPLNGIIRYVNDDIMLVNYQDHNGNYLSMDIFPIPPVMSCSGLYATRLRYKRDVGYFKVGDLLYEYDSFKQSIPTYGYNLSTAYMSFFGLNHEDSIVLSESAASLCRSTKVEQILIPIYTYSLFKFVYDDPDSFGFIPGIGQKIQDTTVAYKSILKTYKKPLMALKSMNITDFTKVLSNDSKFDTVPINSRITNAVVTDIRIHTIDKSKHQQLIDKHLDKILTQMSEKNLTRVRSISDDLKMMGISDDERKEIIVKHYYLHNRLEKSNFDMSELVYLIEMTVSGESESHEGDKFANRFANKGVVSLIIPDELRPYAMYSKKHIDSIVGAISVISRMNFGQILEGLISKTITHCEDIIKQDPSQISDILYKISKIANILGDPNYANEIQNLSKIVKTDFETKTRFQRSVDELGLYFEAPNFANFDLKTLTDQIEQDFNVKSNEPLLIPRKLITYMNDKLKINMPVPIDDIILPDIFVGSVYTIKLKQEAAYRSTSRDFGHYKSVSKQPSQGRNKDGLIGQGSRLGQME